MPRSSFSPFWELCTRCPDAGKRKVTEEKQLRIESNEGQENRARSQIQIFQLMGGDDLLKLFRAVETGP